MGYQTHAGQDYRYHFANAYESMAQTSITLPEPARACKPFSSNDPVWKQKLRKALSYRDAATWGDRWTVATLTRAEAGKFSKAGAGLTGKSFARHMGHEVTRHVVEAETRNNPAYDPGRGSHCIHVILRLKTADNLEDFLGAVVARHAMKVLNARIHATRKPPEDEKPEVLLATIEHDQQGVHVHAVVYNRAPITLEYFATQAREVFAGFTLVKEAHTVALQDDTQLVRVAGYGLKRTVPIMAGKFPALFLGSVYSAKEWRSLAHSFSTVLS